MEDKTMQEKLAEAYQPLFNTMTGFGLTLIKSEMDEIIDSVEKVQESLHEIFKATCDVEGCDRSPVSGGGHWRDKGYWSVCSIHSDLGRSGAEMPQMKQAAIDKENSRDKVTGIITT